jgi:hypothetical protein
LTAKRKITKRTHSRRINSETKANPGVLSPASLPPPLRRFVPSSLASPRFMLQETRFARSRFAPNRELHFSKQSQENPPGATKNADSPKKTNPNEAEFDRQRTKPKEVARPRFRYSEFAIRYSSSTAAGKRDLSTTPIVEYCPETAIPGRNAAGDAGQVAGTSGWVRGTGSCRVSPQRSADSRTHRLDSVVQEKRYREHRLGDGDK